MIGTDVSGIGIGVVLMQTRHLTALINKGFPSKHVTLLVYKKEFLSLVFFVTKWSHYLLG